MSEKSSLGTSILKAALLLLCRGLYHGKQWPPTEAEILELTGASQSGAYAYRDRLRKLLPALTAEADRQSQLGLGSPSETPHSRTED
jgi:hypothetical protein